MAQHPSLPGFEEDLPSSVKSESPSRSIFIAHHGYDLTGNIRDADLRLDYLTPDFGGVTKGTRLFMHPSVQAPSSHKESITSTGMWDVKPEPVTTPSPEPNSLNQVKEELRHLITSRQSEPSTSTGQETKEGYRNPPQIQNGVNLERQKRRREQNRQAAQRCRKRKQDLANSLNRECQSLECSNTELRFQIRTLERERDELRRLWNAHVERHGCASIRPRLV